VHDVAVTKVLLDRARVSVLAGRISRCSSTATQTVVRYFRLSLQPQSRATPSICAAYSNASSAVCWRSATRLGRSRRNKSSAPPVLCTRVASRQNNHLSTC